MNFSFFKFIIVLSLFYFLFVVIFVCIASLHFSLHMHFISLNRLLWLFAKPKIRRKIENGCYATSVLLVALTRSLTTTTTTPTNKTSSSNNNNNNDKGSSNNNTSFYFVSHTKTKDIQFDLFPMETFHCNALIFLYTNFYGLFAFTRLYTRKNYSVELVGLIYEENDLTHSV